MMADLHYRRATKVRLREKLTTLPLQEEGCVFPSVPPSTPSTARTKGRVSENTRITLAVPVQERGLSSRLSFNRFQTLEVEVHLQI